MLRNVSAFSTFDLKIDIVREIEIKVYFCRNGQFSSVNILQRQKIYSKYYYDTVTYSLLGMVMDRSIGVSGQPNCPKWSFPTE